MMPFSLDVGEGDVEVLAGLECSRPWTADVTREGCGIEAAYERVVGTRLSGADLSGTRSSWRSVV